MASGTSASLGTSPTSLSVARERRETAVDDEPSKQLRRFVDGFWSSCALLVAVKLRVADYLVGTSLRNEALALLTETHARSLYRLLRALASVGVFVEDENGYFSLTSVGELLVSDRPGSLCSFVLEELDGAPGRTWEDLLWSVRTGKPARVMEQTFEARSVNWRGKEGRAENEEVLGGAAARLRAAILRAYDFSGARRVVDVGGGDGTFLAFLLQAYESLRGVVFDRPWRMDEARLRLAAEGVTERCRVVVGDFLESVPTGHDLYVLRQVIHGYNDKQAMLILKNCRRAMPPQSKLLLIESVVPPGNTLSLAKLQDLKLMISSEGCERSESEFCFLLRKVGLRVNRLISLGSEVCIIEALRG